MSEVEVVRSALRHAAKSLAREMQALNGSGSLNDVRARTAITAEHLGNWDAGHTLAITTDQAREQLIRGYEEFLNEYQAIISALLRVSDTYNEVEEMTKKDIRAIISSIEE